MSLEKAISIASGESDLPMPRSISVLVVDGDSTCLVILSKVLCRLGYEVITTKLAADALCITRNREDELDLILADAQLPDMGKYELLETLGVMSKLPVMIMSADDNENDMLGGLFKGAALYLVKPLIMDDVKNLWQFAFMKKTDRMVTVKGVSSISSDGTDNLILPDKGKHGHNDAKRKEPILMDKNEKEDNDDYSIRKKPKLIWTCELHNQFLQAIGVLGIDGAHPKKILQYMNVPGLKKENISSHLQKYRLSLKRGQDAVERLNQDFIESHVALCNLSSTVNAQGSLSQFPERLFMTTSCWPEFQSQDHTNVNSCMSIPSLGSAHLLNHVGPFYYDKSDCKYAQLAPPNNQLDFAYPCSSSAGIRITNNEKLAGFQQMVDFNGEEFLEGKMASSNNVDSGLETAVQWPSLLTPSPQEKEQQLFVPKTSTEDHEERDISGTKSIALDELFDMTKVSTLIDKNFDGLW